MGLGELLKWPFFCRVFLEATFLEGFFFPKIIKHPRFIDIL